MATFAQAHRALREYTERFNRLALECANEGRGEVGLDRQDALGPYPKGIPYQWRRRMTDVVSIGPDTILKHREHLDRALSEMCQVKIESFDGRWYLCPIGHTEYTGLTRREIDGN